MLTKNFEFAITKVQNYQILQNWMNLLFNIVYYCVYFVKFCKIL